ncbi:MAG: toprim domain-containing protein [Pseudomonadota bacterium]
MIQSLTKAEIIEVCGYYLGRPSKRHHRYYRWRETGALVVDCEQGLYYDHAVLKGGTIIDLVMVSEHCGFSKALAKISTILGREAHGLNANSLYRSSFDPNRFGDDKRRSVKGMIVSDNKKAAIKRISAQNEPARQALWIDDNGRAYAKETRPTDKPKCWSRKAEQLWQSCKPCVGTSAGAYLEHRAKGSSRYWATSRSMRFCPSLAHKGTGRVFPALVCQIRHAISDRPLSLHLTYLDPHTSIKAEIKPNKRYLAGHQKKFGVVKISNDEHVTHGLAISEGIENALSFAARYRFSPIWACLDAGGVANFPPIKGVECLTIIADHDKTGLKAARLCAKKWHQAGCEVWIVKVKERGYDFADLQSLI